MAIHYYCRHCMQNVGRIDSSVDGGRLGLEQLSEEDKQDMVSQDDRGHVHIKTICEECERTLQDFPAYHEQESFLH